MLTNNYYALLKAVHTTIPQNAVDCNGDNVTIYGNFAPTNKTYAELNIEALLMYNLTNYRTDYSYQGIAFGDDNTPSSKEDYCLKGNRINYNSFQYTGNTTGTVENGKIIREITYTITNVSNDTITIGEIVYMATLPKKTGTTSGYTCVLDRSALTNPLVIETGGVGQLTYRIELELPQ